MTTFKRTLFNSMTKFVPVKTAHKIAYKHLNGRWPDLDNPKRFTEKLVWLTQYNAIYNEELIQKIYDKHTVREYVSEKKLGYILTEEYGNYTSAKEIDFDKLPKEYILKITQSCGENIIVTNSDMIDKGEVKKQLDLWLSQKKKKDRLQGYYFTDDESIMCEELLHDAEGNIPNDIRICCCNGKAKWIHCDIDTVDENMKHRKQYYREHFDIQWNYLPIDTMGRVRKDKNKATLTKPANLEDLIRIAEILAEDFIFVRVDLYNIDGKIYFGELTPIPGMAGGYSPDEWDYIFGDMLQLPNTKIW